MEHILCCGFVSFIANQVSSFFIANTFSLQDRCEIVHFSCRRFAQQTPDAAFLSSITSPAVSRPATPNRQIKCTPLGLGVLCLVSEPAPTARVFQSSTWDSLLSFSLALVYRTLCIKSIDNVYILLVILLCNLHKGSPSPAYSARAGCYCYTVLGNFAAVSTPLRRLRKIGHTIHASTVSSDSASPTR